MQISNLVLAFVTGLISSFGHCLGMCGGIVAIYSARRPAPVTIDGSRPSILARIATLVPVHVGRITTYTFLGALVGLAGSLLEQVGGSVGWQGIFSVFVGIAMVVVALSLIGVLPPIEVALATIAGAGRPSPMKSMRGLFGQRSLAASVGLGILWGFLPCGLVFAMLVVAASTQSLWGGALTMVAFGLGTVPTLLGFGLAANVLSPRLARAVAVLRWATDPPVRDPNDPARARGGESDSLTQSRTGDAMVETTKCEHCGAETKHPVTKVIDGKTLNFCCTGCLGVYEFLRDEGLLDQVKAERKRCREPDARQALRVPFFKSGFRSTANSQQTENDWRALGRFRPQDGRMPARDRTTLVVDGDRQTGDRSPLLTGFAQIPLSLTNAVIAVAALIRDYFPEKPVSEERLMLNMGFMNIIPSCFGGMPLCHGAGGLAGQYYFGARTGGTNISEGLIELSLGLFLGKSIGNVLASFPMPLVGAMLFLVGVEFSKVVVGLKGWKLRVAALTAVLSVMTNMALDFAAGLAVAHAVRALKHQMKLPCGCPT